MRASVDDQVITPSIWPTPTGRDWKEGSAKACANIPVNGLLGACAHCKYLEFCNAGKWRVRRLIETQRPASGSFIWSIRVIISRSFSYNFTRFHVRTLNL